ncbi:hypothetical protein D3C80_2056270 [compost metagenome]
MAASQMLLDYMDKLEEFFEMINSYVGQAIELFHKAKEWIEKILDYIKQGIDYVVDAIGGRFSEEIELPEDYIFV